jgi:hypothetical protein
MSDNGHLPIIGRAWQPSTRAPAPLPADIRLAPADWVRKESFARRELIVGPPQGEPWEVLSIESESAPLAWQVLERLDGQRTLADVALETGVDIDVVASIARDFYQLGVWVQRSELDVPALTFYEHLRSVSAYALQRWGASPLLQRVWTGPVPRRLALGYLLENYHFAAAASSHQGAAVASLPTLRLKTMFSEHLSFEYWHSEWLKRGLLAAGLTEGDLQRASPLVSMQALINHLRWLAVSDILSYSACIGVGEGGSLSLEAVQKFWERFATHGVLPEEVFAPFREHDLGDCSDDHDQFGREPFAEAGPVTAADQRRIRQRLLTFSRLTWCYHRECLDYYGAEEGAPYFSVDD